MLSSVLTARSRRPLARKQLVLVAQSGLWKKPSNVGSQALGVVQCQLHQISCGSLGELVLPALLLWAPARWWATGATVALFIAIQLGAREVFFGGLMVGLVLLFARGDATARALPWTAAVYLAWLLRHDFGRWMAT